MNGPKYGYTRELPGVGLEEALHRVTDALRTEGFGVLTRIDVKDTLRQKLGVDFRDYVILGACNPPLAHLALSAEWGVGLLLPCNVVVQAREGGGTLVSAIKPNELFKIVDRPEVAPIAAEVDARLKRALEKV